MAYTLFWGPVVQHHPYWITPADLWSTYRSAHFVGWGDLGGVYSAGTSLVTFPGILLVLAPVAMLTGLLGLSECFPYYIAHPTAWFVLGPVELLVGSVALFAADSLAERLGASQGRRALLSLAQAAILWNVVVLWGHPEDALAVGLALFALRFALDDRWTGVGWLFGLAMATQPLVVLMLPVLLSMAGRRHALGVITRSALPFAALMAAPLAAEFHPTLHAILDQPNFPRVDHATPWTTFAPKLGGHGKGITVAAGPGRIVALALACAFGVWTRRWRERPELIVWAASLALFLRCVTESVMVSFYIWPVLALLLVVSATSSFWRLAAASALSVLVTTFSDWRLGEFPWWALVIGCTALVLLVGIPHRRNSGSRSRDVVPMIDEDAVGVLQIDTRSPELAGATR